MVSMLAVEVKRGARARICRSVLTFATEQLVAKMNRIDAVLSVSETIEWNAPLVR